METYETNSDGVIDFGNHSITAYESVDMRGWTARVPIRNSRVVSTESGFRKIEEDNGRDDDSYDYLYGS